MKRPKVAPPRCPVHLQLFNRQNTRRLNTAFWRQIILSLLDEFPASGQLGIHLINAEEMARLNQEFLNHAGSTDVITFNYLETPQPGELCGEVFISVDDAVACAPRFRTIWQPELVRYLVHGILHLQGYDDHDPAARRQMKKQENRLLKQLSLRFDWGKLERRKNGTRRK
jgi:probable rRNA maturation factor